MRIMNPYRVLLESIAVAILAIPFSWAGNVHEHLQYQSRFEDILKATDGYLGEYRASSLISQNNRMISNLHARFGQDLFTDDQWKKMIREESFDGLCRKIAQKPQMRKIGVTPQKAMKSFFALEPWHAHPKNSYLAAASTRNQLFFKMDQDHSILKNSIENSLKNGRIWQNSKTVFSVPQELADAKTLKAIGEIYRKKGYMTENMLSITRETLGNGSDKAFQNLKHQLETGVKEGWLHGADVSGSIYERTGQKSTNSRLKQLFETSSELNSSLRIHSFEETNRGQFYDDFWEAMETSAKNGKIPKNLRIGHIQGLSKNDIQRLAKFKNNVNIVFEANLESNLTLNRSYTDHLVRNIESIHKSGMKVALGSDGAGILGVRSNHSMSLSRLMDAGLSEDSINRLAQEAKEPLSGQKWDPDFQKKLSSNTDEMLNRLKKSAKSAKNPCADWFMRNISEIFIPIP